MNKNHPVFHDQSPVFICGTSRSGTNLMATSISDQTDCNIVGETHYFDDLRVRFSSYLDQQLDQNTQKTFVDYFLAQAHRPYGHHGDPEKSTLARKDLDSSSSAYGGYPDSYFLAYCKMRMVNEGKSDWGEKTPRHVLRIDNILSVFPSAKIIIMLRDPRAVVASYRDWQNQGGFDLEKDPEHEKFLVKDHLRAKRSYHPVILSLLWRAAYRAAIQANNKYGQDTVQIVKYETLCENPEKEFNKIFMWINQSKSVDLTRIRVANSSYQKYDPKGGVSSEPSERWTSLLSKNEIRIVEFVCGSLLTTAGYKMMKPKCSNSKFVFDLISTIPAIFRAIRANSHRSGNIIKYVTKRAYLALR